ncbi:MAG: response regulator, partial [Deltaproteobacteria bacterium]|nr:response regulator [Deltaproteobacteria bacterium]
MKVLIAEDNKESRYLLEKLLQGHGHEVTAVANGAEALEQALAQPPDIIVSDIMMPVMDGFQLCHECKQKKQLKNVPFIFYTATYTSDADEKFALSLGANTFVRKPAEPDIFIKILSEELEKARSQPLAPDKIVPLESSLYLTEYNKRIVAKLEQKMIQLETEITRRKQAEEKMGHLNLVLRAIRNVNQLIITEKDRERLIQRACDNLTETRGYSGTWCVLLDDAGRYVMSAEAGVGEGFLPMVEMLKGGEFTHCGRKALSQTGVVVIKDPASTCTDCPFADIHYGEAAMIIRLEYRGKIYGLLSAYNPENFVLNEEEQALFEEVAGDIAFAL